MCALSRDGFSLVRADGEALSSLGHGSKVAALHRVRVPYIDLKNGWPHVTLSCPVMYPAACPHLQFQKPISLGLSVRVSPSLPLLLCACARVCERVCVPLCLQNTCN